MVSVSASTSSAYVANQRSLFSKLDGNSDGALSKQEFVSGRPKNMSEAQAATLYGKIDSENAGSVSEEQFEASKPSDPTRSAASSPFSDEAMAVLMSLSMQGGPPSASDLYADMDGDGDGSVTEAEFVAARPNDVSEKDASALYATIDTEGTGSITEEQFADSMQAGAGSPPPGPPPSGGGEASTEEVYDALDTNQDGTVSIDEFLAGRPKDVSEDEVSALFDLLDTKDSGSITEEQFAALAPQQPGSGGASAASSELDELLALISSASEESTATEAA